MTLSEELKNRGWHISDYGLSELFDGQIPSSVNQVIHKIIDVDLKEYGTRCLPADISRGKIDKFGGNIVLQISHIRNISQPKAQERDLLSGGAQFLKVQVTDGTAFCFGLTLSNVTNLCTDIPPGTKLYLKPTEIIVKQGFILLDNSVCKVLGGKVQHLVDKWELSRSAANSARKRTGGQDGSRPPPWVPFGHRINSNINTKGKALDANSLNSQGKENAEFDEQRKAVIAEALKTKEGTQKKTFSASGVRQIENQDRASNQNSNKIQGSGPSEKTFGHESRQNEKASNNPPNKTYPASTNVRNSDKNVESPATSKPSGQSTLFDFLNVKMSLEETGPNNVNTTINQPSGHLSNTSNKRQFNTQTGSNLHHTGRRQGSGYGGKPMEFGTRNWTSEKKFNSRNDHQNRQKNASGYDTKQGSADGVPHFSTNSNPDTTYHKQYPSLDRNRENTTMNATNSSSSSLHRTFNNEQTRLRNGQDQIVSSNESKCRKPQTYAPQNNNHKNNRAKQYKEGDKVLAKYWEDNKYYPAIIYGISANTCVVQFLGFMNFEEVLYSDVYQASPGSYTKHDSENSSFSSAQNFEFRRGGGGRQYADSKAPSNSYKNQKHAYQPKGDNRRNDTQQQNRRDGLSRQLYIPPAQRPHYT